MFTKNWNFVVARVILAAILFAGALGVQPAQAGNGIVPDLAPLASSTVGNWSALGSNLAGTDGALSHPIMAEVDVIAVSGTDVYVGGCFVDAGGDPTADYIAKWDGTDWSGLGNDGLATPDGALKLCIRAIAVNGTDVYVGGNPQVWNSGAPIPSAEHFAKWDGTGWSGLGAGPGGQVTSIVISGDNVYAGGYFFSGGVVKWDGVNWSALGGLPESIIHLSIIRQAYYFHL